MRFALDDGHADPGVLVALLKAGANPEQDQQYLLGSINDGSGATSGAMITGKKEKLLRRSWSGFVRIRPKCRRRLRSWRRGYVTTER